MSRPTPVIASVIASDSLAARYNLSGSGVVHSSIDSFQDYICDGADDQVEIQAAIDSLPSGGGKVMLSEGTFNITAPITIDSDNVELSGQGWSTILTLVNNVNDYMIKLSAVTGRTAVVVSHMRMEGNRTNQSAGGCIYAQGARRCKFEYLKLNMFDTIGIFLDGVSAPQFSFQNSIQHCLFNDGPTGITMTKSDENYIAFNTTGLCSVVAIRDNSGLNHICYNSIVGISGSTGDGIRVQDAGNSTISFNILDGVQNRGLVLIGSDLRVIGNHFGNTGDGDSGNHSAIYNQGDRNTFIGNIIEGSDHKYAYEEVSNPDDALLIGNRLGAGTAGTVNLGAGTGRRWVANPGQVTENSGTATLVTDQTSIAVTHGLGVTPGVGDVMITPIEAWGSAVNFWISAYSSTTFTITVDQAPGQDVDFAWKASVL